ncbi:hypothetical protein KCU73_g13179, partial [Aureobasidium melanogenum]
MTVTYPDVTATAAELLDKHTQSGYEKLSQCIHAALKLPSEDMRILAERACISYHTSPVYRHEDVTLQYAAAMSEAVGHALILVYKDRDYEGKTKLACARAGNPDLKLPKIYLYNSIVVDGKFKNRLLIGTWHLLGSGDSSGEGRDAAATHPKPLAPH